MVRSPARLARLASLALACVGCSLALPLARAASPALPAGATPPSVAGDALRDWLAANPDVELEGAFVGATGRGDHVPGDAEASRPDLGVFAAQGGLDEGEAYVAIPWRLVLAPLDAPYAQLRPALAKVLAQLRAEYGADDTSALVLALLHERFASPNDSPWRRYFDALPAPSPGDARLGGFFHSPLHWDPHALRELAGSDVLDDAIAEHARVRAVHKGFVKRVFETYPEVFPEFPPPGEDEDGDGDGDGGGGGGGDENENAPLSVRAFEATRWAWSVAHGRASRVPGKPGLAFVPVADLINDRGFPGDGAGSLVDDKKEGGSRPDDDFVVYDPHLDRAAVYAKRRYEAGEEVAESYGDWSSADALLSAGYVRVRAREGDGAGRGRGKDEGEGEGVDLGGGVDLANDCVSMRLVPRNGSREVAEALERAGFGVPARTCASGEGGRRGDREVARWAVACVAAETGALLPDSAGAEGGATAREKDGKDASAAATRTRVFVDAGRLLGEVLAARLRGYPTDAEEDADLARQYGEELAAMDGAASLEAGTGLAEEATARRVGLLRAKMATEFRAGEKAILKRALERLESVAWDVDAWARGAGSEEGDAGGEKTNADRDEL